MIPLDTPFLVKARACAFFLITHCLNVGSEHGGSSLYGDMVNEVDRRTRHLFLRQWQRHVSKAVQSWHNVGASELLMPLVAAASGAWACKGTAVLQCSLQGFAVACVLVRYYLCATAEQTHVVMWSPHRMCECGRACHSGWNNSLCL